MSFEKNFPIKELKMDMILEEYLRQLNLAIEAMMELKKETSPAIREIVLQNYWQKQSSFDSKIKRGIDFDPERTVAWSSK